MTINEFISEWGSHATSIKAHTSGSTGTPKEILLDKQFVYQSAERTINFFNLDSNSHLHLCLSPDYIAGKMMIVRALSLGCRLTYEHPSNRILEHYDNNDVIDLLAVVPSQLYDLLDKPDIQNIRNIIVGGSALSQKLVKKCTPSGVNIYETYGMTETASHVALRLVGSEWFSPLEGISFSLDERECLKISFANGLTFQTNDIAMLNAAGDMKILGRIDNTIITGGLKVHPEDVEHRIEHLLENHNYYITSISDDKWGAIVCLVIERSKEVIDITALENELSNLLAPHERPRRITFIDKIIRTSTGKIRRIIPSQY